MTRADLAIRARRAVVGDMLVEWPAIVVVQAGVITSIVGLGASVDADQIVELDEDVVLLPGLVDTHVHVNEPGRTEWEGFATATRAAAAGGVTTLLDMPLNSLPPTIDPAALEVKRAAARGKCLVDVGFWGGAVPGNLGSLGALLEAGVFGVKCFLSDSGVPEFDNLDGDGLLRACAELAALDGLLLVHAEDPARLAAAPKPHGPSYGGFVASRPAAAEHAAIAQVVDAARATGVRAHIVHLSSAGALPLLESARETGVRITVETCPHYLTLAAEQVPDGATEFKCCPPIRDDTNRDRLWGGLSGDIIDLVVSDHSPCTTDLKCLDSGDFGDAWGGISSLQLGLPLVWTEARRRRHSLGEVVRWMADAPARLARLTTKGQIAEGRAADFVVFAPDQEFVVDPNSLHHRNKLTPYAGRRLTGVVRETWLAGQRIGAVPRGRLLSRGET